MATSIFEKQMPSVRKNTGQRNKKAAKTAAFQEVITNLKLFANRFLFVYRRHSRRMR